MKYSKIRGTGLIWVDFCKSPRVREKKNNLDIVTQRTAIQKTANFYILGLITQ